MPKRTLSKCFDSRGSSRRGSFDRISGGRRRLPDCRSRSGAHGLAKRREGHLKAKRRADQIALEENLPSTTRQMHNLFSPLVVQSLGTPSGRKEIAIVAGVLPMTSGGSTLKPATSFGPNTFRRSA